MGQKSALHFSQNELGVLNDRNIDEKYKEEIPFIHYACKEVVVISERR